MIPLLVGAGVQAAGTIASLIASKKANDRKEGYLNDYLGAQNENYFTQKAQNEDWFNKANVNYADTAEAQSAITQMNKSVADQNEVNQSNSAITGASNAAQVAAKKANQEAIAKFMSGIAGRGTQYKNTIDNQYFLRNKALSDFRSKIDSDVLAGKTGIEDNKIQNWSNFTSNLGNIGMNVSGTDFKPFSLSDGRKSTGYDWLTNSSVKR